MTVAVAAYVLAWLGTFVMVGRWAHDPGASIDERGTWGFVGLLVFFGGALGLALAVR